jgi:hypothetical protein
VDDSLVVGSSRIGHLYDGLEDTPHVAAQLSRSADGVQLELSLLEGETDFHTGWFKDGVVPTALQFRDTDGAVALVGCRFGGHGRNPLYGHGRGKIEVEQAVIGAGRYDYSEINALRSKVAGMARWSGLSSVEQNREHNDESRLTGVTVRAESKPAVTVGGAPLLSLTPYFSVETDEANGATIVRERALAETRTSQPSGWTGHLRPHRALQDLLALAYWWPCSLEMTTTQRDDDPYRDLEGASHGPRWFDVVMHRPGRQSPDGDAALPHNRRPLFVLADIGPAGVATWISEYEDLGRPMWVLTSVLYQGGIPLEARLLQIGTALEALGFRIAGKTCTFVEYLRLITSEVGAGADVVRGTHTTIDDWAAAFNKAYKGVKHADNPLPTPTVAHEMAWDGSLLARLWLGTHLGADPAQLADRARYLQ